MKEVKVTELVEGKPIFESEGTCKLKITKEGVVQALILPIRSTGVAELIDSFTKKAPRPPVKNQLVQPDSGMGKEMRLARKQWVKMLDFSDPGYVEAKDKHDQDLGLAIMLQGLSLEIKGKDGNVVTDADQKVKILKGLGMTGEQFTQVVRDIQALTQWDEEREDHFFDRF